MKKIKITRNQNELSRLDRFRNLDGAFSTIKKAPPFKDSVLLLIDDVMTTGATLNECSGVLLDEGVKLVKCLTLARGI